jgi:hypothetical protein
MVGQPHSAIQVHFRFARAGPFLSFSNNFERMLKRVYRIRAARRLGKSEAQVFAFPKAPASHEQVRAQA